MPFCGYALRTFPIFVKPPFRKSPMSVNFPPAILGLEMAAPILWAPGIFWFFLLEKPHAHEIPRFRGGGGAPWAREIGTICPFGVFSPVL